MRRLVFAMTLLSLAACSSHSKGNADGCGAGIINGSCLSSSSALGSSTVMILAETNDGKDAVCSGTLIDHRLVLTAQHCAQDMSHMAVVFSDHALTPQNDPNGPYIKVDFVKLYSPTMDQEHDLAVVHLESDAPANYTIRSLPSQYYDLNQATSFTNVGYGITNEDADNAGVLRTTTVPASALVSSAAITDATGVVHMETAGDMLMFSSPTTGVCHGDSGGPLYANDYNGTQLVGVAEAVAATDGNDAHECHGVSVFVDIRKNLDFIQQASADLNSGNAGGMQ